MIDPAVFICAPLSFSDVCKIYPPTVSDVVANTNFSSFQKLLTITQDELQYEHEKSGNEG
jgi:hypothetical protein